MAKRSILSIYIQSLIEPWTNLKYFLINKHDHVPKNKLFKTKHVSKHNPYLPHLQQAYVDDIDVADNYVSIDINNQHTILNSLNQSKHPLNTSTQWSDNEIYADFRLSEIMNISKLEHRNSQSKHVKIIDGRMDLHDFQSKSVMKLENSESKSVQSLVTAVLPQWLEDMNGFDRRSKMIICGYFGKHSVYNI